ncbi:MAG: nicotinate-nucleotide diphosphorylase (carboxylating), partial [Pseudomonadota bacterium]
AGKIITEASGGISIETVRAAAEAGVDLISVGALTHSVTVLDFGLDSDVRKIDL